MIDPYSSMNLKINRGNMRFLPHIMEAERTYRIPAAILATIITAEALMRPCGGDATWDEHSVNEAGSAAGLAQFTTASWLAHSVRRDGLLRACAIERGFADAAGEIMDKEAWLEARFDARLSILLTAEMARRNFDSLASRGIAPASYGPGGLAKILYLAHHEGADGAFRYLIGWRDEISREQLERNVPPKMWPDTMSRRAIQRSYTGWLENYIDRRIDVRRYLAEAADVVVPRLASLRRGRPVLFARHWLKVQKAGLIQKFHLF